MIPGEKGFTLIEIVIALLVLGLVAVSAVQAAGNAVNNLFHLKEQTFAHWVAMNRAAEITLAPAGWERDPSSGSAMLADIEWSWEIEIKDTPEPEMREVAIRVWPAGGEEGEAAAVLTVFRRVQ
ncbi:type II secretion system minor pseudopilin GspI [Desulfurivibrio alkaliphilus]|uniref:Type II secretion system protein I n=1 Tax=Desulfurivibrio alkaliphilus (strain DSM 19089 / UNIQEM U267 / AHT2) TaxID=589865 RepID=D6Z6F9_DESAT|nr:type II secretion system minor pseudopilin GspI [Desulfurivibrio alkaliphilus]ADH86924.1 general secretion pathway protein I [Desulfurivibrio alkaliphilus AHT 2]